MRMKKAGSNTVRAQKVLIVDDDITARMVSRQSLESNGFTVVEARDGMEALAVFQEQEPSIILMDVEMPHMDGFESCRQIRSLPAGRAVPILMVTGLGDIESIERSYEAGATDFAPKPINWLILAHRVRYMLRASEVLESLQRSETWLSDSQRIARLGNWEWNRQTGEMSWSNQMYSLLGLKVGVSPPSFRAFLRHVPSRNRQTVRSWFFELLRSGRSGTLDHGIVRSDRRELIVQHQAEIGLDENGQIVRISGTTQDLTQLRRAEEQIQQFAYFDSLTGLANRRSFKEQLKQALAIAKRNDRLTAILFVDLDDFKRINDTLGHDVGDLLLKQVAERIVSSIRVSDCMLVGEPGECNESVARLGGDEFIVLLREIHQAGDACLVAQRVVESLRKPVLVAGHEVVVTPSIGIAVAPYDGNDTGILLKNADTAMYHAKRAGKDSYQFFAESMNAVAMRRLALEDNLRKALDRSEMYLQYQPQSDLSGGPIAGVEALLRWNNEELGQISPSEFIPVAEETGLILPIGEWVLRQACMQAKAWEDEGLPPVRMAINVSPRQLSQQEFSEMVSSILRETGLEGKYLEIEVAESYLMNDIETSIECLKNLKETGVHIAVDDFGTGYLSFSDLKRFPIDSIKIDQSFIKDITGDPGDGALAMAMVAMGHNLKLRVTAEGVESAAQQAYLRERHCDEAQGYHIGRPLASKQIAELLRSRRFSQAKSVTTENCRHVVLSVGNHPDMHEALRAATRSLAYRLLSAATAAEAVKTMADTPVDVVVASCNLDEKQSLGFMKQTQIQHPRAVRIAVSDGENLQPLLQAIHEGTILTYLPDDASQPLVRSTLENALQLSEQECA